MTLKMISTVTESNQMKSQFKISDHPRRGDVKEINNCNCYTFDKLYF